MDREVKRFSKPEELVEWADTYNTLLNITKEDARILLGYMKDYGYVIGSDQNGNLYRQETAVRNSKMEPYSIDEVIDMVVEWNYERILDMDARGSDMDNESNRNEEQLKYKILKEEEARLDRLFDKTIFGREVDAIAKGIAEAVISIVNKEGPERAAAVVADGLWEYSAGRKGR